MAIVLRKTLLLAHVSVTLYLPWSGPFLHGHTRRHQARLLGRVGRCFQSFSQHLTSSLTPRVARQLVRALLISTLGSGKVLRRSSISQPVPQEQMPYERIILPCQEMQAEQGIATEKVGLTEWRGLNGNFFLRWKSHKKFCP